MSKLQAINQNAKINQLEGDLNQTKSQFQGEINNVYWYVNNIKYELESKHNNEIGEVYWYINQNSDNLRSEMHKIESQLDVVIYNGSCHEYWTHGVRSNGLYLIQPSLDLKPIQVYCSFDNWSGTTIISPKTKQGQSATPNAYDGCDDKERAFVELLIF